MKTNALFLIPNLKRAGAETQLVALANNLPEDEFNLSVACFDPGIDQRDKLKNSINFYSLQRKSKYDKKTIKSIAHLIDEKNIDFIHCTLQIALFYGWAARLFSKRKPKLLVTVHTTVNFNFRAELFDWVLYQWIMRQCDSIIFVCKEQQKHWERKWRFIRKKAIIIYNGIDAEHFHRNFLPDQTRCFRTANNIASDAKIIAHIAGFRTEKGHAILVGAFQQVAFKEKNAVLVFAGDGVLRPEIESLCQQMKISHQVRFIGSVSDVRPLLANAHISIIASTSETFSMAMLESMAMDVPLVAINVGGTKEAVVAGETGWLVEPGDTNALPLTINEALSNEVNYARITKSCREKVLNNFTVQRMAAGYTDLFLKSADISK